LFSFEFSAKALFGKYAPFFYSASQAMECCGCGSSFSVAVSQTIHGREPTPSPVDSSSSGYTLFTNFSLVNFLSFLRVLRGFYS
ncbi:MAG: hypothetical protein LBG91_00955, partial [Treponema sp.]|nr:hypothetical protein [Treponema sp.]